MLNSFIVAAEPNGAVEAVEDVNDNSEDRSSMLSVSVFGGSISCKTIKIWKITLLFEISNAEAKQNESLHRKEFRLQYHVFKWIIRRI